MHTHSLARSPPRPRPRTTASRSLDLAGSLPEGGSSERASERRWRGASSSSPSPVAPASEHQRANEANQQRKERVACGGGQKNKKCLPYSQVRWLPCPALAGWPRDSTERTDRTSEHGNRAFSLFLPAAAAATSENARGHGMAWTDGIMCMQCARALLERHRPLQSGTSALSTTLIDNHNSQKD